MSVFRVVLTKRGTWRGQPEEWSNGYHFSGDAPSDRTAALAFFDALWNVEKNFIGGTNPLVRAYYYDSVSENAVVKWGRDWVAENATLPASSGAAVLGNNANLLSLEQAALVRWRCGETSKGKPRYVMKYYHQPYSSGVDAVAWDPTVVTAQLPKFTNGTLPGSAKLCRPDGQLCAPGQNRPFVTTRTLKRRGKRPSR